MGTVGSGKRTAAASGDSRRAHEVKTFNAHTLEALKKSNQSEVVRRLIATVEQAWSGLADRTQPESTTPEPTLGEKEEAFAGREKVLVAVDSAGLVRVFSEKWIAVKLVELRPWDGDERLERIAEKFFGPYWDAKEKCCTVSRAPRTLEESLEWFVKVESWNKFLSYREAGKLPELLAQMKGNQCPSP